MFGWGLWRLSRPEWIFGISTDDHARILAAWAVRHDGLTPSDVWAPLPTLVTGAALLVAPWPRVVPGIVNLAWSGLAVYAVARIAGHRGAVLAAGLFAGSVWFGWLANSALAEPPYVALLCLAALALSKAHSRNDAWWAVLPAALAGACRYEGWAALVVLPLLVARLPGSRQTLVAQTSALAAFPAAWMVYHQLANGDALGFLHDVTRTAAAYDPRLTNASRVADNIADACGLVLGLAVATVLLSHPRAAIARGLGLLLGIELAVIGAHLLGATGVHNGPRHHLLLLAALSAGTGASVAEHEGRRLFAGVALAVHLGLQLPRAGTPPAAHSQEVEQIARAASALLARPGIVVIDVDDDEEVAFKALIGDPERVRYARDDEGIVRWREATGRTAGRARPGQILDGGGVLGVITSQGSGGELVIAKAGGYVLLSRE